MRTRLTAVLALLTAVLLGLVGLAPAHADPLAPVTASVGIKLDGTVPGSTFFGDITSVDPKDAKQTYQWVRDGVDIVGGTSRNHTVVAEDVGHMLSLRVVFTHKDRATTTLESAPEGPIVASYTPPVYTPQTPGSDDGTDDGTDDELDTFDAYRPLLMGKVRVGQVVHVETDADDYDETTTLAYQWLLGGKPAKKGTSATFKLKKKHRGMVLSVQVTASAPGYETETVTSRPKKVKR